jgi:hypothetical protein
MVNFIKKWIRDWSLKFITSYYPLHDAVVSEFLAKRSIPVLSHPPYSLDLAPADTFISKIKNCVERDEIRGCFIDPADRDNRAEGDKGRSVFSGIWFLVWAM